MTSQMATLRLNCHVYEDHTVIAVARVVDLPVEPSVRRLAHRIVDVGRADFTGLDTDAVLALLAREILLASGLDI